MALQSNVYQVNGLAEVGGLVDTATTALVNEAPACRVNGTAVVGAFVWATTAPSGTQVNSLEQFVSNSTTGSSAPLGIVYRVQDGALASGAGYTLNIANGQPCPVAIRGRVFAKSTTAATVGQKVLASKTDGSISTGASATEGTIDTGWVVKSAASIGQLFIIERY